MLASNKDFEQIAHTADIKIRVYGKTKEELFKHALQGMFQIIKPVIPHCYNIDERITCEILPEQRAVMVDAPDLDALLVDFLSEALYLSDVHNEAYFDVTIEKLNDTHIEGILYGIQVEGFEAVEIKAVTYHDLKIEQINGVWQTDIVFDI